METQKNKKRNNNQKKTNKKPEVVEKAIDNNRCSQSGAMAGDIFEVTQLLCEALNKENSCTQQKETKTAEKDIQSHHVDSIEMSTLNQKNSIMCEK